MSSKDHWRITTAAIQLEMERISGLLQKSVHFQSRTSAPQSAHQRPQAEPAKRHLPADVRETTPVL
jgi:hypothetical protein